MASGHQPANQSILNELTLTSGTSSPESEVCSSFDPSLVEPKNEIIFVDSRIANYQQLIDGIVSPTEQGRNFEVILLDSQQSGLDQINKVLTAKTGVQAIHLIGEGNTSELWLGSSFITQNSLNSSDASQFRQIGEQLSADADILIYGCNFANGEAGMSAIRTISELTGADVAASSNRTGNALDYGDWTLEASVGLIETQVAIDEKGQQAWLGALAALTVDTFSDTLDGTTTSISNLLSNKGTDGKISLREAIIAANNTAGSDTIVLGTGTYLLSIAGQWENGGATGDLDILSDITITGSGIGSTIINGGGIERVFDAVSGTLSINSLEITGASSPGSGGGINVNSGATVNIAYVDVHHNTTGGQTGGGVSNQGTFTATDSLIRNNQSGSNSGSGLYNAGTATLTRVSVVNNTGGNSGGGIEQASGTLTLTNVTVSGNSVLHGGAGIEITGGSATISYSTIANNDASNNGYGGGINMIAGSATISNSIVVNNVAKWTGNDIYGAVTSGGYNIIESSNSFTAAGTDITGSDAGLGALSLDSTSGQYVHALSTGSAAIDAASGGVPATDQRGVARSGSADIGAYELAAAAPIPPSNTVPTAQTTNEDTAKVFSSANGNQISITDADAAGGSNEITLSVTNGTLTLSGVAGLTFVSGDGAADTTMTFRGTASAINTALNGLSYMPTTNYNGSATLTLRTLDSTLVSLNIDANLQARYTFEGNANDVAPGTAQNGTLTGNATFVNDATRGQVLSLDGNDDYVDLTSQLASFSGLSQGTISAWVKLTATGESTIFDIGDGAANSTFVSLFVFNGQLNAVIANNGTEFLRVNSNNTINDGNWHHVSFTVNSAGNALYIDGNLAASTFVTGSSATTKFISDLSTKTHLYIGAYNDGAINGDFLGNIDDLRIYDRALNGSEVATLAADLSLMDADTVAVTVTAQNDAPTATNLSAAETYTEDTVLNLTDIVISDVDSAIVTATLTLSNTSAGSLNTATSGAVTSTYNAGTGVWTASGAVADVNNLLAGLTFTPAANFNSSFTIATSINDGTTTLTGSKAMTGIAVENASTISIPTTITATEDTNVVFSTSNGNAITIGDPDGTVQQVTISVPTGALTLGTTTGLTFTVGDGLSDSFMTFSGTIANINVALNGLTYVPSANYNGTTSIRIVSGDAAQATALDTDASLLIRYSFDNPSQLNDDTATTASGTNSGAVSGSDSTRGNYASFDGADDGITTANFNTPSNFTVGVWAKSDTSTWSANGTLLSKRDSFVLHPNGGGTSISMYVRNTSNAWNFTTFDVSTISNFSITDWHHYGASFDGSTVKLFIDGVERGSVAFTGTLRVDSGPMTIGRDDGNPFYFDGSLDDARLYSRALSGAEMATLAANSSAVLEQTFTIAAVNDAPVATNLSAPETFTEDTALNLTDIFISDIDSATVTATLTLSNAAAGSLNTATSGAVTSTYNTGTGEWTASGTVADVNTLLAGLTFTPATNFNSSFTIATSISDGAATITGTKVMTGTAVNDAPVLDNTKSPVLSTINEDAAAPSGVVGTLVSTLVDFATPTGQVDNISDADSSALLGIAITTVDTTNGSWWYSTNNGTTWNALGAVSHTNALLLAADANTRIYFQPNLNYNGTLSNAITFHAWDQSSGTNGGSANITVTNTVLDSFSAVSYNNNNGTGSWSTSWVETDSNGGGAGGGRIRVNGNQLDIRSDTVGDSIYREVNLSGSLSAILSFTYSSTLSGGDNVVVRISNNGGTSYTNLPGGAFTSSGSGTFNLDISAYISSNTRIQFYVAGAGNKNDLLVDNVQISYTLPNTGGTTGYSSASDSANLVISAINDAPTATNLSAAETYTEDTALNLTDIVISDVDSATLTATLTLSNVAAGSLNTATSGAVTSTYNAGTGVWTASGAVADVNVLLAGLTFTPAANLNSSFTITTSVSDGVAATITGTKTMIGTAVNDAPTTSAVTLSAISEDSGARIITQAELLANASDVEGNTLTATGLSITSGSGSLVNNGNGTWTYTPALNDDSSVSFSYTISDGNGGSVAGSASLDITPVNDAPVITSNGGGATATDSIAENQTIVTTLTVTDVDLPAQTISYSIVGGADAALFTINASTGVLQFISGRNYESPTDADANNVYEVIVQSSDGAGGTDTQAISVSVTPVNEAAPVITSNGGETTAAISISENATAVTTVTATDNDLPAPTLSYSISGGADAAKFTINSSTGALSFIIVPNYENAADAGANNVYDVTVTVSDGSRTDTQDISVTITNLDEVAPTITSGGVASAINENSGANQVIYTASSADSGDTSTGSTSYSLSGADAALFSIDTNTGAVTLTGNPNFEAKASYSFNVIATDAAGNAATQAVTLAITNLDEVAPTITSGGVASAINENSGANQVIYTASSADSGDTSTGSTSYSLSGADAALFSIDTNTGAVTLTGNPNFEAKASYSFNVIATDAAGNAATQAVTLAITNLDEVAPTITSGGVASAINENSGANQVIYTASSADSGDTSTGSTSYSLSGADAALFSIDTNTGAVTLTGNPNFEAKASYSFNVIATDAAGNAATQAVTLAITNLDEVAPTITSGGVATAIKENSGAGQVIYTATSTDSGDTSTGSTSYSLGGADAGLFSINAATGAVTLLASPNYEAKASYSFTVTATDAAGNASAPQAVTLAITNLDEPTTGKVTILGVMSLGQTLTINDTHEDPDGIISILYTWLANGVPIGFGANHTLTESDIGKEITVVAKYTDIFGISELVTSTSRFVTKDINPSILSYNGTDTQTSVNKNSTLVISPLQQDVNGATFFDTITNKVQAHQDPIVITDLPSHIEKLIINSYQVKLDGQQYIDTASEYNEIKRKYSIPENQTLKILNKNIEHKIEQSDTAFLERIDDIRRQFDSIDLAENPKQIEVQVMLGATVAFTAGFVSWVLRGGALLSSLMSAIPLINRFDPIPILRSSKKIFRTAEKETSELDKDQNDIPIPDEANLNK